MASVALSNDPTDDKIVEEKEEVNTIKDNDGKNVSQLKHVEGKDEETNFQVEKSINTDTALVGSEEKPEGKSDSAVEVKKEKEDNEKASGPDDLVGHGVEEVDHAEKQAETSAMSEPAAECTGKELKSQVDVFNTPVPQSEVVEKPKEHFEESSVQESESQATEKQAVSESTTEKVKGEVTEPSTVPSSISEEENRQKEPPIVSAAKVPASNGVEILGTGEGAKNSQDTNKSFDKTVAFENLSTVVTNAAKLEEAGKGAVALEVEKEEEDNEKASGSDDLVGHGVEEVHNAEKEAETSATSEPATECTGEKLKNQPDVSNTPVPQSEVIEKPKEHFEESSVQESESQATEKQAVSESATEKVRGEVTGPSTVPSSISEEENKQKEPSIVSAAKAPASNGIETLGTGEGAKNSQEVNKSFEETVAFKNLSTVVTNAAKLEEAGKGAVALEVKKGEEDNEKASGSDDLVGHGVEEVHNAEKEAETSAASEPTAECTGEELKNQPDVSNTPVPQSEVIEKPKEHFEESSFQESESQASEKQAVSESVTEKAKGEVTEPSTVPSSISEEENKQNEPPIVSTAKAPASNGIETLGTEEGAKNSQGGNANFEETVAFENLSAVVTNVAKLQEAGKGAVALEDIDALQKADADLNASRDVEESATEEMGSGKVEEVVKEDAVDAGKPGPSAAVELVEAADESSVIKITEDSMKPESKVEEIKQEKITEAEEPNQSEKSKIVTASEVAEVAYEGEKVSGSTEKVEEDKNEGLQSNEPTLAGTSKDLRAATEISEGSLEERKVSEGADMVENKDEHLKSKEEITRDLDDISIVAEASFHEEEDSKGATVFEETKDEGLKDEKVSGLKTSKDFDAASEVAEFSLQEKVSRILEIAAEKEESLESDKMTSVETSESSYAAAVSSKDGKSSITADIVDKKDNSLKGDKTTLVETSKDFDVVTDISAASLAEEKTSGGTKMVQEKDEKEKSPEGTQMINEKKNEALEGARKTLGETFKEDDMAEKNVISASAAGPDADSEKIEKDKKLAKDIAETGKPDDGNIAEPSKDGDVIKQDKKAPKQGVHKASRHHSSNIFSKTKHLIVKAKKAIFGKSPSSKTMSAGTKDDIKVK